jgi:hypothetical protein
VSEEQGQAPQQPEAPFDVNAAALAIANAELGLDKPRDEQGKFVAKEAKTEEAKPETEAAEVEEQAEETEEAPPEVRKHKLTVKAESGDDEELEVDEDELKRGYMKSKDYSAKTAALKRERESVQAEIKKATEQKLKEYDEKLEMAEQAIWHTLAPEIQNTDWNKLAQENPAEWAQKYQTVQNVNGRLAQVQAERQRIAKAREDEARANYKKQAEEAIETLKADIPGWNQELYGKVLKAGVEHYGFKKDEVNAISDSRAIKVLHDAMQFRALKAKPIGEKKVVPPAPKVAKPGAGEKADPNADKWKQGMDRLRKSGGKMSDATDLAMQILQREG